MQNIQNIYFLKKLSLEELDRIDVEAFKAKEKASIILVMDNIRSALNVGSAFRTADAFALEGLFLCGITATPPHRQILKTAIGATSSVDWTYFERIEDAVLQLKSEGYKVYAVEQMDEKIWLQDFEAQKGEKIALVFGNEVKGVSDEILGMVDAAIEIPQFGTKHSLNVSVSIGVVVWDVFQKMNY